VAVAIAFVAGAHQPVSLLLVGLSIFAADMNLRAVIRKSRDGRFGGAGGYLAHVGVGIFLAGVVISGVYAVSTRVMLPIGQEVKVGGSTLTFLRVVPATATSKQAMEVRVKSAEGKIAYAYPKMYVNSKTNQMMANPAIRNSPLFDFYVAPQSYDPGTPEQVGREVRLVKGTTTNIDGTGFTFRDFSADRAAMMNGGQTVLVLTDLTITPPDGTRHDVTVKYTFHMDRGEGESAEQEIPGIAGARVQVLAVSPKDGAVVLRLMGVSKNPADEHRAATTESLSVDVTRKPLISLVWGGFYVMMAGALVALYKRAKETRKAVLSESTAAVRVPAEPVPPAGSPIPVHTRSRI
jgi:cytochrome c biogenesis protein ResB